MPNSEIKVEIITERRLLFTQPSIVRGGPARIVVDVCVKCSSVVFDVVAHDTWHRSQS